MPSSVLIERVTVRSASGTPILRDVSLRIAPGESVGIIGRSGAGKTSILRLLNGLVVPDEGRVEIDGAPLTGDLAQRRRSIGTILQAPALFPHLTVYDNVAVVPRLLSWGEGRIREAAEELLTRLELPFGTFAARFPWRLSGGEQQRVAIARATIASPPLLLCDEPFSALDPLVRRDLQDAFIRLCEGGAMTLLFVTHDVAEALRVAARVVLVDGGAVLCDEPRQQFVRSADPLVRRFIESARLPEAS